MGHGNFAGEKMPWMKSYGERFMRLHKQPQAPRVFLQQKLNYWPLHIFVTKSYVYFLAVCVYTDHTFL